VEQKLQAEQAAADLILIDHKVIKKEVSALLTLAETSFFILCAFSYCLLLFLTHFFPIFYFFSFYLISFYLLSCSFLFSTAYCSGSPPSVGADPSPSGTVVGVASTSFSNCSK
jgi:hypothetical protein